MVRQTLFCMDPNTAPPPAVSSIDDLFTLTLVDGLKVEVDGRTVSYRVVKLRETTVADERAAQRMAERVVVIGGQHKLLMSDADFQTAMTVRHIDSFRCDGQCIPQAMIDLDLIGRLSGHDFALIEQRVFLITLAAEVRYGNLTQAEFEAVAGGKRAPGAPQPRGQAEAVGHRAPEPEPGPALLADYAGSDAGRQAAGVGR